VAFAVTITAFHAGAACGPPRRFQSAFMADELQCIDRSPVAISSCQCQSGLALGADASLSDAIDRWRWSAGDVVKEA